MYGLVLAGGKSVRMGKDKGAINWHGKEQRIHMADMLSAICDKVFISCREEQDMGEYGYDTIVDSITGSGPLVAIRSAFLKYPNVTWMVVACDLPLLDHQTLSYLVSSRDSSKIATTFKSPFDGLPEPLITIWEPSSGDVLEQHVADGYTCPRKALIRNQERVKIVVPIDDDSLLNANTPADAERVLQMLNERKQP